MEVLIGPSCFTFTPYDTNLHDDFEEIGLWLMPSTRTRLNATMGNMIPEIDDQKKKKLEEFFQMSENPLLKTHLWDNAAMPAIDVIMIAAGKNYQVLSELWEMMSEKHRLEIKGPIRQFIFGQTLNCFDPTCRSRIPEIPVCFDVESKWSEVKLWAVNVLRAMRVSLPVPVGSVDRQLILAYCTYLDIPDVIDAFQEIGADPIFADENTQCILHYAVFKSQTKVLKRALQLFKESNISVDSKDELGQTAYFNHICELWADEDEDEDEALEWEK